ncbi:FecR family protein [Sinomicrobium soli]|uniref:FecR family protein n=1 Tax=Sinomicrobium sp. N-1-3-6 TaxID=2219864 RepID=UPI000DCB03E5|nr:FecR domain-containing protein [Sinomicrobium sp. N-1-3-6]RAV27748.1 iron dicitrate transport regulator FecR [Sinomicrobium sp. N-1-3-6]
MEREKILHYLRGLASEEEKKELLRWVNRSEANRDYFYRVKAAYVASRFPDSSGEADMDREWQVLQRSVTFRKRAAFHILRYAAVFVVMLGLGALAYTHLSGTGQERQQGEDIPEGAITLRLDNGNVKIIREDGSVVVEDPAGNVVGKQQGKQLVYTGGPSAGADHRPRLNTLTVPYAKTFDLVLSDGTRITLNSGTSITYPDRFAPGGKREVTLEGEAYFRVAKDSLHPFVVNSGDMNIRVLGTEFNVSSYPEDKSINTVLVEGAVSIYEARTKYSTARAVVLQPGQIAVWDKARKRAEVGEADADLHTAWINGRIIFRHTPFEDIVKKLERHYDVVIVNENTAFEDKNFTASFDVETIEQVMEAFGSGYGLKYRMEGNKIIIE